MTQTAQTVPYESWQHEHEQRKVAEQERDDFKQKYYSILDEKRWEKKWDAIPSSTKLQRIDKDLIKQLVRTDQWGKQRDDKGRVRVNFTTYAKNLGVSDDTISRRFERLTTSNLILDARPVREADGDRWYVRINKELIQEADHEKINFPEETPKQGGDRYFCQKCGSKHVKIKRTIKRTLVCLNPTCKHEVALDDLHDEYTLPPKHAERAKDAEDVKATCFLPPESNLRGIRNPSTPPQVAPDPDPELERQAGQLLIELATGESHIEMNTDPAKDKYSTIGHSLWMSDALRHLRGIRTKGAVGRSLDGQTRGNCFDADTPEEWQLCKDAALVLAAVGFKPILLPSPSQGKHKGGGLLWFIHDQNVDAYSAQQTIYHHAPQLKLIRDFWPGGGINMRLPGSKYRCPDFEAWINLYNEDGEELSRDGQNLAAVLLDRQTPAGVVDEYSKPEPTPQPTKPEPGQGGYLEPDLAKQIISEFNAMRSWPDIVAMAGGFIRGKFLAVWRNDTTPNMAVWSRADMAKDFARPDEPLMDKYDVWCRIMANDRGQDWQEFKRLDLQERCEYRRKQQEQIAS